MRPQIKKSLSICKGCPRLKNARCTPTNNVHEGVDILLVGDQPEMFSAANNTPFLGHGGRIVKEAVKRLASQEKFNSLKIGYAYALQCQPTNEDDKPRAKELDQCRPYLESIFNTRKPKVVVALGAHAMRAMQIKAKHKDLRGKHVPSPLVEDVPVFVTFGERALLGQPGLYETFCIDIKNAMKVALTGVTAAKPLEEISKDYLLPETIDEAIEVVRYIHNYCRAGKSAAEWPIAVDTETTSLHPQDKESRLIAFSFAWDKGKSATVIYDHPNAAPEYLARLPELHDELDKLLKSSKPKIYWNAKFDIRFTDHKYGFKTNNLAWDGMLGEHLLEEDKKGNYGLKAVTAAWLPEYCGYEDKLWDLIEEEYEEDKAEFIDNQISDLSKILRPEHTGYLDELAEYKKELKEYERQEYLQELAMVKYQGALEGYYRARVGLDYLVQGWHKEVERYEQARDAWKEADKKTRGKRPKKPLKPKRWHSKKPKKPKTVKRPKPPKDPRSKKEIKYFSSAGFEDVPLKDLQVYAAVDTDVTRQMSIIQLKRIAHEGSEVKKLMKSHSLPATKTLAGMEYRGTRIDLEYLDELDSKLRERVAELETEIYNMALATSMKGDLNLHGPDLGNVLYNWGWQHPDGTFMSPYPVTATTSSGLPSRAEATLRQFVDYEDDDKEIPTKDAYFVERWLTYSKAYKALNTFVNNVRMLSLKTGCLHTSFHINGTGTGRLSSSDMNLQNIPKFLAGHNIKKLFIPRDDSLLFVDADYSGAEVRVFTAYARDPGLIEALNEGLNMHSFFASKVFGEPYEDYENRDNPVKLPDKSYRKLLDKQRQNIKRVVFGILYGAGPNKIAESIGVTKPEAEDLIALLFSMFPSIKGYIKQIDREVDRYKYVETLFHRRRRFPLAGIRRHRNRAARQARNFKVQSTSSDIVLSQLIEIDKELHNHFGDEARMLLTVHDSMCLEFPKKYISQLEDFLTLYGEKRVGQKYPWLPVPFQFDIECGPSYGECMRVPQYMKKYPYKPKYEGAVEEQEILNELRDDAYEAH